MSPTLTFAPIAGRGAATAAALPHWGRPASARVFYILSAHMGPHVVIVERSRKGSTTFLVGGGLSGGCSCVAPRPPLYSVSHSGWTLPPHTEHPDLSGAAVLGQYC